MSETDNLEMKSSKSKGNAAGKRRHATGTSSGSISPKKERKMNERKISL